MANYKLSTKAAMDIADIYEYGILQFGIRQAQTYLKGLEENLGVLMGVFAQLCPYSKTFKIILDEFGSIADLAPPIKQDTIKEYQF